MKKKGKRKGEKKKENKEEKAGIYFFICWYWFTQETRKKYDIFSPNGNRERKRGLVGVQYTSKKAWKLRNEGNILQMVWILLTGGKKSI